MNKKALLACLTTAILLGSPLIGRIPNNAQDDKPAINFHTPTYTEGFTLPQRISKDITIGPEQGIILINGNTTVEPQAHLKIKKGTIVAVREYGALTMQGSLTALGTSEEIISFIINEQNETNKHWGGILFESGSSGNMNNISIHHATPPISCTPGSSVSLENIDIGTNFLNTTPVHIFPCQVIQSGVK